MRKWIVPQRTVGCTLITSNCLNPFFSQPFCSFKPKSRIVIVILGIIEPAKLVPARFKNDKVPRFD